MNQALALGLAASHAALIGWLIVGGLLCCRYPSLVRAHVVAVAATAAVFIIGADCPLTIWENHFREAAGWDTYDTGFVSHYLIEPVHAGGITPLVQIGLVAAWAIPTVVGHGLRVRKSARAHIDPDPAPDPIARFARR